MAQVGGAATVALAIADPGAALAAFQKTKKIISKHRTMNRSIRKNHVYKNNKVREKSNYKRLKNQYNTTRLKYLNGKFGYEDDIARLKQQYQTTKNPDDKKIYEAEIQKLEKNRKKSIKDLDRQLKALEAKGEQSTDPELKELQDKFREMYSAKSDIRLDADYKKAQSKYNESLNEYVNSQYDYQTKITRLKETMAEIADPSQKAKYASEIKKLEKEMEKEEAKSIDQLQEDYLEMVQEKVLYKNAKYQRNTIVKGLGAMTGASILADMAQNEITASYEDSESASKEEKRLKELQKIAKDEENLRGYMSQIKSAYDSDSNMESNAYEKDMADLMKDAKKTVVKTSTIKSVVSSYLEEKNIKKVNGDNIIEVLDILAETLKSDNGILINDSLKTEIKRQLEEDLIKNSKGLGYDKKDATVAISSILGQEGMVETLVDRAEVRDAVSEHMKNSNTTAVRKEDIDSMINDVQESIRVDLPDSVKDTIRNRIERRIQQQGTSKGIDQSTVSNIINSEIRKNNIEDRSRYHKSLSKDQVEELRSKGIAINTEEYYSYLETHGIKDTATEKARNEARQTAREINTRNENAKVKLGGSLVNIGKTLYKSF